MGTVVSRRWRAQDALTAGKTELSPCRMPVDVVRFVRSDPRIQWWALRRMVGWWVVASIATTSEKVQWLGAGHHTLRWVSPTSHP